LLLTDFVTGNAFAMGINLSWAAGTSSGRAQSVSHLNSASMFGNPATRTISRNLSKIESDAVITGVVVMPFATLSAFSGALGSGTFSQLRIPRGSGPHVPKGGHLVSEPISGAVVANAGFRTDPDPCTISSGFVSASIDQNGGGATVRLFLQVDDICTGQSNFISETAPLPPGAFAVSTTLNAATLRGTVQFPQGPVTFDISGRATEIAEQATLPTWPISGEAREAYEL
jgi:hypothetical protein